MNNDLLELHERLEFATKQTRSLEDDWANFVNENIFVYQYGSFTGDFRLDVEVKKPLPVSMRVKSRWIANEVKSCLDALACTLAIRNGKDVTDTYFPSPRSEAIYRSDGLKKLRKLTETDREKITSLQPWKGGHEFLHALHEVDRAGKHQGLVASHGGQEIAINGLTYGGFFGSGSGNVYAKNCSFDGTKIAFIHMKRAILLPGPRQMVCEGNGSTAPISPVFSLHYSAPQATEGWNALWALEEFGKTAKLIVSMFDN